MEQDDNSKYISVDRKVIHLLAQHGYLNKEQISETILKTQLYPSKEQWHQRLYQMMLGLGAILMLAGVIFFFAYNWNDLHKFVKLGIAQGILVMLCVVAFVRREADFVFQVCITAAAVMVGVNFVLFGQIYQTGANAVDLFQAWTLLITLWVMSVRFAPLWLLYIVLLNTTLILYAQQMYVEEYKIWFFWIISLVNLGAVVFTEYFKPFQMRWFVRIIATALAYFITVVMFFITIDVFDNRRGSFSAIIFSFTWVASVGGAYYYYRQYTRDLLMLTWASLSVIAVGNVFILRQFSSNYANFSEAFFLCSVFTIVSTLLTSRWLINLYRVWQSEASRSPESYEANHNI